MAGIPVLMVLLVASRLCASAPPARGVKRQVFSTDFGGTFLAPRAPPLSVAPSLSVAPGFPLAAAPALPLAAAPPVQTSVSIEPNPVVLRQEIPRYITRTITRDVPVPVVHRVPVPVPVVHRVSVPVEVPRHVPVYYERRVPYPVRVPVSVPVPYPVTVERRVPVDRPVYVERQVSVPQPTLQLVPASQPLAVPNFPVPVPNFPVPVPNFPPSGAPTGFSDSFALTNSLLTGR